MGVSWRNIESGRTLPGRLAARVPGNCLELGPMAYTIAEELRPTSVLDLGAGPCCHGNALCDNHREVVAVDSLPAAAGFAASSVRFVQSDLARPLDLGRTFDVVLCLELIEHLSEEVEDTICRTMVRHTGRWLVATAAAPGQQGHHHVNLKPLQFWITKIVDLGLQHEPHLVAGWQASWRRTNVLWYYVDNLMIFRRPEAQQPQRMI